MIKYILVILVFSSCTGISGKKNTGKVISAEKLDTIKTVPQKYDAQPVIFEKAFIQGSKEKIKQSEVFLYGVNIGNIKTASGSIIACDPMLFEEYGKPFTQVFPTGEFRVELSIAKFEAKGELVAFARIRFNDNPVERWELALLEGQKPQAVGTPDSHAFIVDNSLACFIDKDALKALNSNKELPFGKALHEEMNKHYRPSWQYALFNFGNHNMAAYTPGFGGDAYYSTYIGFDGEGKPCRLLTDFNVFEWWKK